MVQKRPRDFDESQEREKAPREIEPSSATPRSTEQELAVIGFKRTEKGEELQIRNAVPGEGWVAGVPVVDGVADSGWVACKGGRVRLVVRVTDRPDQREWLRAMAHGGAYAREMLA